MLLRHIGATVLRTAYTQAAISAAADALRAIMDARDMIHAQLAQRAERAISDLQAVAAMGETTIDALVRAGRTEDAKLFADQHLTGAELLALYALRDATVMPGGLKAARRGHIDCTRGADPTRIEGKLSTGSTAVDRLIIGLRAGGALWFPTCEQALAAAEPIFTDWQGEAERVAAVQRGHGGMVAFW
jgi:hypothetical protein